MRRRNAIALPSGFASPEDWARLAAGDIPYTWGGRNDTIASLIPAGVSVLDIGAGDKNLRRRLRGGCKYTSTDFIAGADYTTDFNSEHPLPDVGRHDVAVISGLLEYLVEPGKALRFAAAHADKVIVTYFCIEVRPSTYNAKFSSRLDYVQLLRLLRECGLSVLREASFRVHTILECEVQRG